MTDNVIGRLREIAPGGLSIRRDSSTWLNVDTGARVLHVRFGDKWGHGENHGVYYQAPNGELSDITFPVSRIMDYERKLQPEDGADSAFNNKINLYLVMRTEFDIEKMLGLCSGEFPGVWPERDVF